MTSADSKERTMRRNLYDLYEIDMELWSSSVKKTIRPRCQDKSALLANAASLYAVILNEL